MMSQIVQNNAKVKQSGKVLCVIVQQCNSVILTHFYKRKTTGRKHKEKSCTLRQV